MNNLPPKYFLRFFRWFCHPRLQKPIEGDLMELYEERVKKLGKRVADRKFRRDVMQLFRPSIIKPADGTYRLNNYGMLRHNLLIIFRNFRKYKSSFLINLIGLSTGLASFMLIYLWVNDEVQKDKFHEHNDRLYQVMRTLEFTDGRTLTNDNNSVLLAPEMLAELAEVEIAVPVMEEFSYAILEANEQKIKAAGKFVGEDFFEAFSFNLVQGSKDKVLSEKSSIVISQFLADKFFKDQNPIGKSFHMVDNTDGEVEYEADYIVSGVFDNAGLNSSEHFDFLLPNGLFFSGRDQTVRAWESNGPNVYILLREGADPKEFDKKLSQFYEAKMRGLWGERFPYTSVKMHLQTYSSRYLYGNYENGRPSGGRISYVYLFSIVGVITLLIACVNFINLSTALASRRLKEVGVKKVFGTTRKVLISQHFLESFILVFLSFMVALILLVFSLPSFNAITGKALSLNIDFQWLGIVSAIIISTTLLSGTYPAFYLSRLKPIDALQSKLRSSVGELLLRKGLIIFQFSISIILIVSVIVISKQIDFVQSKNLGYDRENVITFEKDGALVEGVEPFLAKLETIPGVKHSTVLEGSIAEFNNSGGGYKRENKPYIQFTFAYVGYDYVETVGLELKEGRSFSREFANEDSKIILNETAIAAMGLEDPLGKIVNIRGNREVIGILKDFHLQSLHENIKPSFLIFEPGDANNIAVKLQPGKERETIEKLEEAYHEFNPGLPFEFTFLDDEYNTLYQAEQRVATLSSYFASIAILISCLGLFGLTAFITERRIKEIGIRKVLGSSRIRVVALLSGNMLKMLVIAMVIAIPIAFTILGTWLDNFAYRIELSTWFFVFGALATIVISCFTVGFQTWKAASVNPVKCLKDE